MHKNNWQPGIRHEQSKQEMLSETYLSATPEGSPSLALPASIHHPAYVRTHRHGSGGSAIVTMGEQIEYWCPKQETYFIACQHNFNDPLLCKLL